MAEPNALVLQFTDAGINKLYQLPEGAKAAITHIALGDGGSGDGYELDANSRFQTALVGEVDRVQIASKEDGHLFFIVAGLFDSTREYAVKEVGLFLSDGTLLAFHSSKKLQTYKSANFAFTYRAVIDIRPLPTDSVEVVIGANNANLLMIKPITIIVTAQIKSDTAKILALSNQIAQFIATQELKK